MFQIMDYLYDYWIGQPDPAKWPEYLQENPVCGHGRYCFRQGIMLGLLLFADCAGAIKGSDWP